VFERRYQAKMTIRRPIEEVFAFFSLAENLQRITPANVDFRILTPLPIEMRAGTLIDYRIKVRGFPMRWRTLIETWEPPFRFVDTQIRGPYALWHHTHEFVALADGSTEMTDVVRYRVPFGVLGLVMDKLLVNRDVRAIFDFRRSEIEKIFSC
jgi:ligand-binding SRPBCC domain-containing protein